MVEAEDDMDAGLADTGNVDMLPDNDGLACALVLEPLLGVSLGAPAPTAKGRAGCCVMVPLSKAALIAVPDPTMPRWVERELP
jgi:hypothetical protein